MDEKRALLMHFLAALAYRTQKAVRDAPDSYASYSAGHGVRTPHEILWHMHSVLGYARTRFTGGEYDQPKLPTFADEIQRFHDLLESLRGHLGAGTDVEGTTLERLLQGPLADAMTHAGQLAMLRRMSGTPIPPENFMKAGIDSSNVGTEQPAPVKLGNRVGQWPEAPKGAELSGE